VDHHHLLAPTALIITVILERREGNGVLRFATDRILDESVEDMKGYHGSY
jgi:hypothetical protein